MAVPDEIKSAETTGRWEKGLSSVSKGKMAPDRFMGSIKRFVMFLIDDAKRIIENMFLRQKHLLKAS